MSTLNVPTNTGSKPLSRSSSHSSLHKAVEHEDDLRSVSRRNSESHASPEGVSTTAASAKITSDGPAEKLMQQYHHTGKLNGPTDFHTLQHYLGLYVLAKKADMEPLQNKGKTPKRCSEQS